MQAEPSDDSGTDTFACSPGHETHVLSVVLIVQLSVGATLARSSGGGSTVIERARVVQSVEFVSCVMLEPGVRYLTSNLCSPADSFPRKTPTFDAYLCGEQEPSHARGFPD